ncbi:Centrosomal protein of 162 kDa [Camelus dromedarius]|uniref:Centrosomal protein of 162 kDa n=1 Tax=Camelus dromedarius TaxID=9838 RepID=A0A5N4C0D8_CAMDR|nr:Centrosomal protein of 162 kDa [Camelus dromedarius]
MPSHIAALYLPVMAMLGKVAKKVVLLGSLDSVAEGSLDEQDKATAKPKALPGVTDNEMTGTGESEKLAVLYVRVCD